LVGGLCKMSTIQVKEIGETIEKFIKIVDDHLIKPKKEQYYNLVRHFKYCKQGIKDINFRKRIRRKSIRDWVWVWVLYFCKQPKSAFNILMNTKRESKFFVNEYWILKSTISEIDQCINDLDDVLDQFEMFSLNMKKELNEYK